MKVCAECGRCFDDSVNFCTERNHQELSRLRDGDPEMIPGYRLDYLLESGVRGESYRAHQTRFERSCLIRVLPADKTNNDQFADETRRAAAFFHANVIDVYEAGALQSGELFVVAEDGGGKDLRGFLDTVGVPDLLTSVEIIRQSAEALDALHREGLVHRAINPENIILTNDANGRLLVRIQNPDFGGVVQRSIVSNKFLIDSALDSLRYFAPEQCSGEEATPQTDVYSLGVVFYEMLAGVPPFDASKAVALIEKHRSERPPDVKINNFNLRMLVTHALTESLQKQPKLRQQTANALARQLRHIEQLANHVSTPPPAGVVPPEPVRTSPHVNIYESELKRPVIQPIAKKSRSKRKDRSRPVVVSVDNESRPMDISSLADQPIIVTEAMAPIEEAANSTDETLTPVIDVVGPVADPGIEGRTGQMRSRLSRLKLQMKTWRSKLAPQEVTIFGETTVPIAEPNETILEAVSAAKLEGPVVQPTKLELEIEDDIPTVDEVLEVLAKEPIEDVRQTPIELEEAVRASDELLGEETPAIISKQEPIAAYQGIVDDSRAEEEVSIARAETEPLEIEEEIRIEPETAVGLDEVVRVESEEEVLVVSEPIQIEEIPAVQVATEEFAVSVATIEAAAISVLQVEGEAIDATPAVADAPAIEEEVSVIQVEEEIPMIQVEGEGITADPEQIDEEIPAAESELETLATEPPAPPESAEKKYQAVRRKRQRSARESFVTKKLIDPRGELGPAEERIETQNETPVEVPSRKLETTIPIGHMQLEDAPLIRPSKPTKPVTAEGPTRISWVKGVLKPSVKEVVRIPVVRDELEEITLVRVSKPIRIDVARPSYGNRRDKMFSVDTQEAVRFVPTLLGDTEKRRTIELDPKDAMFSSLGSPRTVPTRIRRRLIAAGCASVLLIAGFLFAADLGRYLQAANSDESAVASSDPPAPAVEVAKPARLAKTEKPKNVAKPPVEKESTAAKEKSSAVIEKTTTRGAKPADKSKPKPVEASKRPAEKKSAPAEKKNVTPPAKKTIGTRARVVGGQ